MTTLISQVLVLDLLTIGQSYNETKSIGRVMARTTVVAGMGNGQ